MDDSHTGPSSAFYVLQDTDDGHVSIVRARGVAESMMEAPDADSWVVYDDGGYRRELYPELPHGGILIGARASNETSVDAACAALHDFLERVDPAGSRGTGPYRDVDRAQAEIEGAHPAYAPLVLAVEAANRRQEAESSRRLERVPVTLLVMAGAALALVWWLIR